MHRSVPPPAAYARPYSPPTAVSPFEGKQANLPPVQQDPLHDRWDVVRIERGKDADAAWAKIFGSPAPPPATLDHLYISDAANEENTLFPMWQPRPGQPPNKSLPAPLTYGPFKVRLFCFDKEAEPFAPVKTIDLYSFNPFLRRPAGPLVALGIYELDGDHLKICLRAAIRQRDGRPRSFQVPPESGDILLVLQRHRESEDEKALEGHLWTVVGETRDGKSTPPEELRSLRVDFDLNQIDALVDQGPSPNNPAGARLVRDPRTPH